MILASPGTVCAVPGALPPGEALPDEEKDYDRHTAIGTLKLIMKLGFQITNGAEGPASVRQE